MTEFWMSAGREIFVKIVAELCFWILVYYIIPFLKRNAIRIVQSKLRGLRLPGHHRHARDHLPDVGLEVRPCVDD
jgi:hypothetical protein